MEREEEWYKKFKEADVNQDIPFFCKIGQVEACIFVYIEPDPHGDTKGTHAHFHTGILCPKIKIVDYPEPDRCQITDDTCPFWEPFGGYERDTTTRKRMYIQQFIHHTSFIEFYGKQLVNTTLKSKGFKLPTKLPDFSLAQVIQFLLSLAVISSDTEKQLTKLRKKRNEFVHFPEAYKKFEENELFELASEAKKQANILYRNLQDQSMEERDTPS